jgi:hypothetical protein
LFHFLFGRSDTQSFEKQLDRTTGIVAVHETLARTLCSAEPTRKATRGWFGAGVETLLRNSQLFGIVAPFPFQVVAA